MRVWNLKAQTILAFFLVLGIGMLLLNAVSMQLWKRQALSADLDHGRSLLAAMARNLPAVGGAERFSTEVEQIVQSDAAVVCVAAANAQGKIINISGGCEHFTKALEGALANAVHSGAANSRLLSPPPGNDSNLQNNVLLVAQPFRSPDGSRGGVAMVRSTEPIDGQLWENEKIILVYILANAVVLAVVGFFRMVKLVVRPLERLAEQADTYSLRHDFLPFSGRVGNEFGRLSSSLNRMIAQLEEDRGALMQKVDSLRLANEELDRNRREMVRAEKMASIGRLAAGLAHEIGNPLGVVQGYLDLLGQGEVTSDERKEFARRAEQEVTRVGRLIRQLLDYARPVEGAPAPLRVRELLADCLELFRQGKVDGHIEFSFISEADEDLVLADGDGLRQIFVNCLMNAVDAIGPLPKGRILARCFNEQEGDRRYVRVVIEDNGPGIAQEHLESVFEPFFTTKEPGSGTGLGLAVSCSLVEKWGGRMWAESGRGEEGRGAAIWISLPLAPSASGGDSPSDNGMAA
ncbi:sensor histidine kinase [Thiovibrio frasassiensis]|uniref:histidine kinase n=1 Tax=Thiovibrio frasassiensis TaxID=2984131 RepID=A0A9X4MGB1_9BACT|nr:HAMP domain-containing sensor histidine kinase [Thiovibrio frasassiensis]MDG4475725.1 HAMP domain-containing histidine kinase [Thiovibrio frasassiensis]